MSMDAMDFFIQGSHSNCCGAMIDLHGMCSECGEHADDKSEEGPSDEKLDRLNAQAHLAQEKRVLAEDQIERELREIGHNSPFHK